VDEDRVYTARDSNSCVMTLLDITSLLTHLMHVASERTTGCGRETGDYETNPNTVFS